MERRIAILATLAATLLCGCPGLCILAYGGNIAATGRTDLIADASAATWFGVLIVCAGCLSVLVPLITGLVTFRRSQPEPQIKNVDDPIPDPLSGE
ncbi:MAG: hypothetical protein DWQ07_08215 [Chloroflexi bacterium]|nr:MAG: hypothetical protein DWQ07_08215 [Chloroflexota bacterium]MBL1193305.1 hypothetical protein [Chloroflexota bacterium]NOH10597.1 hypothetical protein [Chloroflexota bacterium]